MNYKQIYISDRCYRARRERRHGLSETEHLLVCLHLHGGVIFPDLLLVPENQATLHTPRGPEPCFDSLLHPHARCTGIDLGAGKLPGHAAAANSAGSGKFAGEEGLMAANVTHQPYRHASVAEDGHREVRVQSSALGVCFLFLDAEECPRAKDGDLRATQPAFCLNTAPAPGQHFVCLATQTFLTGIFFFHRVKASNSKSYSVMPFIIFSYIYIYICE